MGAGDRTEPLTHKFLVERYLKAGDGLADVARALRRSGRAT
jgi:hypothetical protein